MGSLRRFFCSVGRLMAVTVACPCLGHKKSAPDRPGADLYLCERGLCFLFHEDFRAAAISAAHDVDAAHRLGELAAIKAVDVSHRR